MNPVVKWSNLEVNDDCAATCSGASKPANEIARSNFCISKRDVRFSCSQLDSIDRATHCDAARENRQACYIPRTTVDTQGSGTSYVKCESTDSRCRYDSGVARWRQIVKRLKDDMLYRTNPGVGDKRERTHGIDNELAASWGYGRMP